MPELLPQGSVIFGYQVERLLGRGGMGTVYLARQQSLNRPVALKVLHPHLLRNPAAVEDFLREARATARLNHPHLVTCHDAQADPVNRLYCWSMEYVPGRTVTELMKAEGTIPRATALHLIYQIASAIGYAHHNGLVHRDIKPENIVVTANGVAKLLDLGLARDRIGNDTGAPGERRLMIVGTPEFSAPEQSRDPRRASAASDVYSLGATLFYMLTGKPPFLGDTVIDLIVRAATEELVFPQSIPEDCRELLSLMLAREVDDRLPHGAAVVAALEAVAQGRRPELPEMQSETAVAEEAVAGSSGAKKVRRRRLRRYR
jgi:serine/threonine-protein kinase